jgi:hypothetical protein
VSRPSSGRPGSPHRYFGGSYDVAVEELLTGEGDDARKSDGLSPNFDTADVNKPTTLARIGRQVVHRHRNGLCIVTAGDVLEQMIISGIDETTERNKDNIEESTSLPPCGGDYPLSITALHFHVEVGKDSKSAKGKIRSRNNNPMKKRKRPGNTLVMNVGEVENITDNTHDGNVLPHDPLCTISLSDGRQVQLYCCVGGTVIEINNNLLPPSLNNGDIDDDAVDAGGGGVINNTYSVLLTNPLLDGYLAVIMPGRKGDFSPPQCR